MALHKAMAIPVIRTPDGLKFLVVLDKRFKEWTFVTGGCRQREIRNPLRCALRELEEETRGVMNLKRGTYSYFRFTHVFSYEESIYHVYIFFVDLTLDDMTSMKTKFDYEKLLMDTNQVCFRKQYDENDSLDFATIDELRNKHNIWPLVYNKVIQNSEFYTALNSEKNDKFYIVY
jgi:8-oxo-dGTP pyrophosphatase MutT (NUDIX family)